MDAAIAVQKAIRALISTDAKRATVYLTPRSVVSVCRRFKRRFGRGAEYFYGDFVVKVGRPNYLNRKFIKACAKAGEPLPVRKVQLRAWPIRRKAS